MSETRYAPEDLTLMADTLAFVMEEGARLEMATDMLRQAAHDARVIEQLRAFVVSRLTHATKCRCGKCSALLSVLAALDRLAPPQRQE